MKPLRTSIEYLLRADVGDMLWSRLGTRLGSRRSFRLWGRLAGLLANRLWDWRLWLRVWRLR